MLRGSITRLLSGHPPSLSHTSQSCARPEPVEGYPQTRKPLVIRTLQATVDVCRLMLGFWEADVCIYPETCTLFAKRQLAQRFLPWAALIILVRLLSCNPLVGLARRRLFSKNHNF